MARWERWVRTLKETHPTPCGRGVRVVRRELGGGSYGETHRGAQWFTIVLDARLQDFVAWLVLLHEYAHCLTWGRDEEDHGDAWGAAYAMLWREYHHEADHQLD